MSLTAHPHPAPLTNAGTPPFTMPPTQGAEVFALFLAEIDRRSRKAAREEYELLLAEKAEAAIEAEKNDQVLTVQQAASLLGVRPQTVYEWIKADKLKSFKVGRSVRLKRGQVLAALQVQMQPDGRRKYARRGGQQKTR